MSENKDQQITIDGKEYKLADLSEQAKAQITHLRAAEAEIHRLKMLAALMQTAHSTYAQALKQELAKSSK